MANLNKKEDIISMPQMKLDCINVLNISKRTIAAHMLGFIGLLTVCQCLDFYFLRRLSQPLIVTESIVGLLLSNLPFIRKNLSMDVLKTLGYMVDFGMIIHMFGVGLEINPNLFFQIPLREAKVAMAGMFTAFILCTVLTPFLHVSIIPNTIFDFSLSLVLTSTASPILTSLVTDLKIAKSDIGKFVISAGMLSDLVPTLFLSLGYIIYDPFKGFEYRSVKVIIRMSVCLVIETLLAAKATPILMNWVNRANPEGKSMKGSHLVLTVGFVVLICSISPAGARFSKVMSAFLAGFVMPKEGRISKMMIRNAKGFGRSIFFPLFFFWVGTEADLNKFEGKHIGPWVRFFFVFVITTVGKVAGSVTSGVMLGFRWPDSVAIGLLLNIKGHFQVYLAIFAARVQLISVTSSIVMLCVGFLTIIYTPLVVANIIERARKRSPIQRMALQWPSPSNELRIMLCLNGPQHLKSAINFMEISRGPIVPGLTFYVTDMVELTDKIAASLTHSETSRGLTMTDRTVTEMRENITTTIQAYLDENGEGVNLRRNLALSTKNNMHQDICILADNLQVSIIILPFHKDQEKDGKLNGGCSGFRNINRKVFRNAPCSVGILVDRGLGSIKISRSSVSINVAIVFIGGKDDREALAFAGRVARHPGVKLTVIRFLLDPNSDGGDSSVSSRITRARANTAEHTEEMKLDDEYFADFYSQYVAGGPVAYVEKYLVNSGQTFSTLRSLEGQYALFIVGRGGRVNSVLTIGMNDWEECPELGPIGDILSASDFSVTSSVLVIQQHSLRGELQGLQDEFSIM